MIRTEAITVRDPRHNRKTYVLRSPYLWLTPGFRPFATQTPNVGLRTCCPFARNFPSSNSHPTRRAVNPEKILRVFYRSDPQRQHASRLLPRDPAVLAW